LSDIEIIVNPPPTIEIHPGGAPGPEGGDGPAGTITVGTVTTGAPGTDAEVENVGTATAAILNFTIPEGEPGEDGVGGGGTWGSITGTLTDQTDLASALGGKAASSHTHAESDVTGLTAALAGKSDTGHTHAQSDVTGLTAALAGKSDTGHTHTSSNITDFNAAADARVVAGITGKLDTSAAPELIRDTMGTALVAGANITITPNDGADTITISETVSPIAAGSANNPHITQGAARNSSLPKNFWQYTGTEGVDDPTNWTAGDEWINA
jgi:hypothetical protein